MRKTQERDARHKEREREHSEEEKAIQKNGVNASDRWIDKMIIDERSHNVIPRHTMLIMAFRTYITIWC